MASLLDLTRNVSRLTRPTPLSRPTRGQPTQYELEMRQFVQPVKEEEEKKRNRRPLLKFIFDILQVGNYASANVVDSIVDSVEYDRPLGEAAWDAIKSGIKGAASAFSGDTEYQKTFSDIIRQNADEHGKFLGKTLDEWERPIFGEREGKDLFNKTIGKITPSGVAGLAGDILLDPLTYISPLKALKPTGMASQAARASAGKYAANKLQVDRMLTTLGDLQDTAKVVGKKGGMSAARQSNKLYKEAYRYALSAPEKGIDWASELQKGMRASVQQVQDAHIQKTMKELTEQGIDILDLPEKIGREMLQPKGLDELTQAIEGGYGGAGQRAFRIGGREVGKSVRPMNVAAKQFDKFRTAMGNVAEKTGLAEAWYSLMNGPSIVGLLNKTFGIRNPYQKLLRMRQNDATDLIQYTQRQFVDKADTALRNMGEDLVQKATDARAIMEQLEMGVRKGVTVPAQEALNTVIGGRNIYRIQDIFGNVDNIDNTIKVLQKQGLDTSVLEKIKSLKLTNEEAEKIGQFWDSVDGIFKDMRDEEVKMLEAGLFKRDEMGEWTNYIPKIQNRPYGAKFRAGKQMSPAESGFMKETKKTFMESKQQGIDYFKEMFGDWLETEAQRLNKTVDEIAADIVEKNGLAPVSQNLIEMLNARITAHARVVGRGRMVESFREFGIPESVLNDLSQTALSAQHRMGAIYNNLMPSTDPSMTVDGVRLLFDQDVKDIIDKTYGMIASDDTMGGIKKLFMNYTTWWKGIVTATTGFHLRNFFSNNVTGFFRHGTKWLNPKSQIESMVGAVYALNPTRFKSILTKQFNLTDGQIDNMLSKVVGGRTMKEIAEEARENGVISLRTYITDIKKELKPKVDFKKRLNPLKQEFFLPAMSRQAGNLIENQARFHSYILTLDDLAKQGAPLDAAIDFAKMDTKKWFLDYGDLTETEQKVLKNVIPFYTWTRKNLANQVSGLILMPDMYRMAAKMEDSVSIDEFNYSLVPEYMKQMGYLPISQGEEGPIMWWPNFPYADLNKIPLFFEDGNIPRLDKEGVLEEFGSISHPILKTIIQGITKKNLFEDREYYERVTAPDLFQFFNKSPKVLAFIDNAMRKIGFENGAGISERNGKLEVDEGLEQLMSNNIPLLKTIGEVIDLGLDLTGFEEAVEDASGRKDPQQGMEDLFHGLTYWAGVKFKQVNEAFEAEQFARQIQEKAEKDRSAWKRTLPGYEQRSLQYQLQREAQRRRIGL